MPRSVQETVEAKAVRVGDVVTGCQVTAIDRKTKYVYLTLAGRAPQAKYLLEEPVTVTREVPTEEERQAAALADAERTIGHWITGAEMSLQSARESVAKAIGNADVVSASVMTTLLHAQHDLAIARQITAVAENKGVTLVEAVQRLVPRFVESLLGDYNAPTYSGGFTVANADRQAQQDSLRKFIDRMKWVADVRVTVTVER